MKNKHFYQIFKLKIKPWIKYWLIKQTEFKGVLSDILEDISFYLTDSLNMKFKMFDVIGRTTQEGDPTPENPVPIKNTGDDGSINEKIQNKNLFNKNTIANGAIYRSNGNIDRDTAGTHQHSDYIEIEENTQYYITIKTFPSSNYGFAFYDNSKTFISSIASSNLITTPGNAKYVRICWAKTGTYANDVNTTQVEKGQTPTDYIEHAEQNISFPLSEGQKLMEGDYLADDGIHHKMREVVLDGTENWSSWNFTSDTYIGATLDNVIPYDYSSGSDIRGLCNYFEVVAGGNNTKQNIGLRQSNDYSRIYLCIQKSILSSENLAGIKAWLNNNKPVLQYELEEEQTEDFTSEQQTAWKEWKKARTYKNITHISSEDETPALLKIQYWKEA